ncbi:hypothetical protein LguiA_020412 [Lonicera macranthoides]
MENPNSFPSLKILLATTLVIISLASVNAQISTPCTASMISSFTPCINFITGSSGGGASPTAGCCDSLRSLMSTSMDCTCLIITGNVPFSLPINQTLAISLPRTCQSSGVPLQCKASGVPLPAPGPVLFGPTPPPSAASPFSPRASKASAAAPPPTESTLAAPTVAPVAEAPTATPGIRPVLTPTSASNPSFISSSPMFLLLAFVGLIV